MKKAENKVLAEENIYWRNLSRGFTLKYLTLHTCNSICNHTFARIPTSKKTAGRYFPLNEATWEENKTSCLQRAILLCAQFASSSSFTTCFICGYMQVVLPLMTLCCMRKLIHHHPMGCYLHLKRPTLWISCERICCKIRSAHEETKIVL